MKALYPRLLGAVLFLFGTQAQALELSLSVSSKNFVVETNTFSFSNNKYMEVREGNLTVVLNCGNQTLSISGAKFYFENMDSETCNRLIVGMSELVQNSLLSQIIIKTGVDTNGAPYVDIQSN